MEGTRLFQAIATLVSSRGGTLTDFVFTLARGRNFRVGARGFRSLVAGVSASRGH